MKLCRQKFPLSATASVMASAVLLASCGGGGNSSTDTTGTLKFALTDAPACGFDAVNVTIQKIRVNQSDSATDTSSGWSEIVLSPALRVNLLDLTNGTLAELGQTKLPAGKYNQIRLVLGSNDAATPLANSVLPTGGTEIALDTPSATQSGLKLNANVEVPAGSVADFVLDFDACKSVVKRGNSGKYNLTPVIAVIPRLSDSGLKIIGYVDPGMATASAGTTVSVQSAGVVVKATPPDAAGKFVLYPVPAGTYDLVVTSKDRATAVLSGVPTAVAGPTTINTAINPIAPPNATMRSVTGTVTPFTATTRAVQTLTGGPTVEVAWGPVNADTGAFAYALPIAPAVKGAYSATATAISFTADSGSAAKYTLVAKSGTTEKTVAIDVANAVPPVVIAVTTP